MKRLKLNRYDSRVSGYFSVGTALVSLTIMGLLSVNLDPWICILMAGFGMLGTTEIANADDPTFIGRHPWLMRLIFCSIIGPAFIFLGKEYFANGLEASGMIAGAIQATIAVAMFSWYLSKYGVEEEDSTSSKAPRAGPPNIPSDQSSRRS